MWMIDICNPGYPLAYTANSWQDRRGRGSRGPSGAPSPALRVEVVGGCSLSKTKATYTSMGSSPLYTSSTAHTVRSGDGTVVVAPRREPKGKARGEASVPTGAKASQWQSHRVSLTVGAHGSAGAHKVDQGMAVAAPRREPREKRAAKPACPQGQRRHSGRAIA